MPPAKQKVQEDEKISHDSPSFQAAENEIMQNNSNLLLSPKPIYKLILFSLFGATNSVYFSYLLTVCLPLDIALLVGEEDKTRMMGYLSLVTSLSSLFLGPVIGMVSDKLPDSVLGRRKPFIFIGVLLCVSCFIARSFILRPEYFYIYCALILVIKLSLTATSTAYMALSPELFAKSQLPTVSTLNGFTGSLGFSAGALMGILYSRLNPLIVSIILSIFYGGAALIVMCFKEPTKAELATRHKLEKEMEDAMKQHPQGASINAEEEEEEEARIPLTASSADSVPLFAPESPTESQTALTTAQRLRNVVKAILVTIASFIKPFLDWDFFWVFVTRAIFMLAVMVAFGFYLYFITDRIGPHYVLIVWDNIIKQPQDAYAVQQIVNTCVTMPTILLSGFLSRLIGTKFCMVIAGCLVCVSFIGTSFLNSLNWLLFFQMFTAMGMSLSIGVGLAFSFEVLPNKTEAAKDLAIFQVSMNIPQIAATPIGSFLIDFGNKLSKSGRIPASWKMFGYDLNFYVGAGLSLLSAALTLLIRKGGPKRKHNDKKHTDASTTIQ